MEQSLLELPWVAERGCWFALTSSGVNGLLSVLCCAERSLGHDNIWPWFQNELLGKG